jgi:AcrR family transcriptional regulator
MVIPQSLSSQSPSPAPGWAPPNAESAWSDLDAAAKHERLLGAAAHLFATEGLDAPMPAVAALAGAGVGSLYRQFPSKRELLAALVIGRLEQIEDAALTAAGRNGDHWVELSEMLWTFAARQADADFLGDAWTQGQAHEQVQTAAARAFSAISTLLDLARAEGTLRPDATALDIRLIFVGARASRQLDGDAWKRVLVLMIDGLAAKPRA